MKLYNPFAPHYCHFSDGRFGLRKLSLLEAGWVYLDINDMRFWKDTKFNGTRHSDLGDFKALIADRYASIEREKNVNKSWRVS
jgi:hypothetical protein